MREELEFDTGVKHTAVITEETNQTFEQILTRRILDQTFDDRSRTEGA